MIPAERLEKVGRSDLIKTIGVCEFDAGEKRNRRKSPLWDGDRGGGGFL